RLRPQALRRSEEGNRAAAAVTRRPGGRCPRIIDKRAPGGARGSSLTRGVVHEGLAVLVVVHGPMLLDRRHVVTIRGRASRRAGGAPFGRAAHRLPEGTDLESARLILMVARERGGRACE